MRDDDVLERLYLIRAEANKMARGVRNLRVMTARAISAVENTNDSPGGHTNDRDSSTPKDQD